MPHAGPRDQYGKLLSSSSAGGVTFRNENLKIKSKCWLSYVLNENLQVIAKSQAKLSCGIFFGKIGFRCSPAKCTMTETLQ